MIRIAAVLAILAPVSSGGLIPNAASRPRTMERAARPWAGSPRGNPRLSVVPRPAVASASERPSAELVPVDPAGITAAEVGARAAATGYDVQIEEERLRGALGEVDRARSRFAPRLTVTARYTRLSSFTPPVIFSAPPGVNQVFTTQPVGASGSGIDPAQAFVQPAPSVTFPNVLDNYLLQASVLVPISDYFLRIGQAYSAATHAARAARFDAAAAWAKSEADGEIAYWTWLRARGAAVVASLAVSDQRLHLDNALSQYAAGNASRLDVLRAETALNAAELELERAKNVAALCEKRVRLAVHAKGSERIAPGEALDALPPTSWGPLARLTSEALDNRLEIKSIEASAAAARAELEAARAAALPQVSALAEIIDANPNPRRIPQSPGWFPTWQGGLQLVWSPNDLWGGRGERVSASVRAAQLEAMRGSVRDGVELEVLEAFQAVTASDVARDVTARQLASASEARRVARQLFNSGRGTSTLVVDAQTELTRARLDALNTAVDERIASLRLRHALGRDSKRGSDLRVDARVR